MPQDPDHRSRSSGGGRKLAATVICRTVAPRSPLGRHHHRPRSVLYQSGRLQFCPACLAATGTIPRFCLLPLLLACPIHRVRLVRHCRDHAPFLPVVDAVSGRVRCEACGADLAPVAGEAPSDEELAHQLDVWRAWSFLLGWRGDDIRGRGYRTIRSQTRNYPLRNIGDTVSFERLVTVFLALQIEPSLVAELEDRPRPPCPNASCPDHVPPAAADPLLRGRQVERHCSTCGSRFIGRRILLTFDADHGGEQPSARAVDRATRRLERWRDDLAEACRQDILAGRRITVTGTFRRAGIPLNANLRATRLGLVDLVRDAARRQRLVEGTEPAATATTTMAEHRVFHMLARGASWRDLREAADLGGVRPNTAVRPIRSDSGERRRDPSEHVLDPIFPPRSILRFGHDPEEVRATIGAREADDTRRFALSGRWSQRVRQLRETGHCDTTVSPAHYPRMTYPDRLTPAVRDFVLEERAPGWMPHFLDERERSLGRVAGAPGLRPSNPDRYFARRAVCDR